MQAQRPGDILIVDADEAFSAQATQTLAQQGHMVMTCRTGAEARRHLERMPYDAVLCGWRLPDEEGIHFCEFVKGQPEMPHVAVALLIDATADDMWVAKLYIGSQDGQSNLGPDELILRSAHMQEVAARVQALLHVRRYRQEIDNALETLMSVAEGVEEQDRRARGHCKRLSIMCIELGAVLGLSEWELTALERAAYLHDIGKVAIPGAIISKVDSLTPREMEIIKNHCVLGEKLCRPRADFFHPRHL